MYCNPMKHLITTILINFCLGLVTKKEENDICELLSIKVNEENKPFVEKEISSFAKKLMKNTLNKKLYPKSDYKDLVEKFELIYNDEYREFLNFCKDAASYFLKHKETYPMLKMTNKSILYFCYCCELSFSHNQYALFEEHRQKLNKKGRNEYFDTRVVFFVECILLMNWLHDNKDKLLESKYFTKKPCRRSEDWLGDLDLQKAVFFAALSIHPLIEKYHLEQKMESRCFKFK